MADRERVVILPGFKMCLETIQVYLPKTAGPQSNKRRLLLQVGFRAFGESASW